MFISTHFHAGAQPLLYRYGKIQGGLPEPLSEEGARPTWPALGNTHRPGEGVRLDPIGRGGGGGDSSTPTTLTQFGQTYPPPHVLLQTVATGGIPRGAVEDPPRREC